VSVRRFDVLFLDFYGTVTGGDRQAVEEASRRVVEDLDLRLTPQQFAEAWGRTFFAEADRRNHDRFANLFQIECETLAATLETLGAPTVDPQPYVQHLEAYWSNPTLQPEAAEALARIDVPICCVSNADTRDLLSAVERHRLRFSCIITSEDARCYKPDPAIFERALAAMAATPDRVLHAGDSLHADVGGARKLGLATAWVHRDGRIFDVGQARPDYRVGSLLELAGLLGKSGERA